jgi:hypothetical protein
VVTAEQHALLSEFHKIDDRVLRAVWYVWADQCLDKVIFEFDEVSLLVEAEIDYDTIAVRCIGNDKLSDYSTVVGNTDLWNQFIGKPFAWGWITINQQNYLDGILVGFDTIMPDILLNVAASSLVVGLIHRTVPDA